MSSVTATGRGGSSTHAGSSKEPATGSKAGEKAHGKEHTLHGIPIVDCSAAQVKDLEKAIAGVHTLGSFAHGHFDPESTAWSNYFRLESDAKGFSADKRFAMASWEQGSHINSASRAYKFKIVCLTNKDKHCAGTSEGYTDSSPMDARTKEDIKNKGKEKAAADPDRAAAKKKSKDDRSARKSKASRKGKEPARRSVDEDENEDEYDEPEHHLMARSGRRKKTGTGTSGHKKTLPIHGGNPNNPPKDDSNKKRPKESSSEPSSSDQDNEKKKDKHKDKKGREKSPEQESAVDDLPAVSLCPAFFKLPALQKLDLSPVPEQKGRPSRSKGKGADKLCAKDKLFKYLQNMSHTLFHEITHLDAFGKAARVSQKKGATSGTEDYSNNYVQGARTLAHKWQTGSTAAKTIPPFRNAESIAASALELYYLDKCNLPKTHVVPLSEEHVIGSLG